MVLIPEINTDFSEPTEEDVLRAERLGAKLKDLTLPKVDRRRGRRSSKLPRNGSMPIGSVDYKVTVTAGAEGTQQSKPLPGSL